MCTGQPIYDKHMMRIICRNYETTVPQIIDNNLGSERKTILNVILFYKETDIGYNQ